MFLGKTNIRLAGQPELRPVLLNLTNMALEKHYSIPDLCENFGIVDETIYRLIRQEKITAVKFGKNWKIPESSLNDYLKTRRVVKRK